MMPDNSLQALKPPSSDDNPSPSGRFAQSRQSTPAHNGSDKSTPYLLAVNTFKNGQEFSAEPFAYEMRRATGIVDDDGQFGPGMTVKFITSRN
jgi:hypothetical protein